MSNFSTELKFHREAIGGTLTTLNVSSAHVAAREVHIWQPDSETLGQDSQQPPEHGVIYMHDGQMAFNESETWNGGNWGINGTLTRLIKEREIPPTMVVAVNNGASKLRFPEYFPQKPLDYMSAEQHTHIDELRLEDKLVFGGNPIQSDNFLKFLVDELKPHIDQNYPVFTDPDHTMTLGSSMGGLISLYALCEYPHIFGSAACLSTHWQGAAYKEDTFITEAFFKYFDKHLPSPQTHQLYFDHGTVTLDKWYPPVQKEFDKIMIAHGYDEENWQTRNFEGADHSENAWKERAHIPLTFLLKSAFNKNRQQKDSEESFNKKAENEEGIT